MDSRPRRRSATNRDLEVDWTPPLASLVEVAFSATDCLTAAIGDVYNIKDSWMWLVCSGIPVDANAAPGAIQLRFLPAFGKNQPTSNDPLLIQRVIVVEGNRPAGQMQSSAQEKAR